MLARLVARGVTRDVNRLRAYLRAGFQFGSGQDFDPARLAQEGVVFKLRTGVQNRHYDRWHYIEEKRAVLAVWEHHLRVVLAGRTEAAGKVVALR